MGDAFDAATSTAINKFESDDIQDLALANMGEAGVELAKNMGLIIILLIVSFILGWAVKSKLAAKKMSS